MKQLLSILVILLQIYPVLAKSGTDNLIDADKLPAFPGAEGHGKYVTGGRGGKVIYVTTLEDHNNQGSLRYAINQSGPRMILFKVSGTIHLKSGLNISKDNITIAGQTAPGGGITLRDYPVTVNANNVIIRFIRFRMGDKAKQEADALGGRNCKSIIVDHCSMSWSTDECVSFYGNENFTLQWSIISESLRNSVHGKGKHGYGGIWGGIKASFHHNLLAHHDSRNPRFCGSRYSNRPNDELVDFRNNIVYNWGSNSTYGAEGGSYNLINNYYKDGPATSSSKRSRIIQPYSDDGGNSQPQGTYGIFHIIGNYVDASNEVTTDNWLGVDLHSSFSTYAPGITKNDLKSEAGFATGDITTHTAEIAYQKVIEYSGASLSYDSVDMRILHDVFTKTATITDGGNGSSNGLIDTQEAVGGWPQLKAEDAPVDSDNDGMPDNWETSNKLDLSNPNDAQLTTVDGRYPNIEVYINSLVSEIVKAQNEEGSFTTAVATTPEKLDPNEVIMYLTNSGNQLVISHTKKLTNVNIYNITGKLLTNKTFNQRNIEMNVAAYKKGTYIVLVRDLQNRVYSKKIVRF